jgi:predicted nucleic acid-binding protein
MLAQRGLPIEVDAPESATVFQVTQGLCRKHGLTAYDAGYLELAMRNRVALTTADAALERAARAEVVSDRSTCNIVQCATATVAIGAVRGTCIR